MKTNPGSVSNKSTGQGYSSTASSNQRTVHADTVNPKPNAAGQYAGSVGTARGPVREYMETPHPGITEYGVGSLKCNDAACEQINKHPRGDTD